jgi:hypothetical protein
MNQIAKILSLLALAGTIVPAALFMFKALDAGPMKLIMLASTALWFAASPFWLKGGSE